MVIGISETASLNKKALAGALRVWWRDDVERQYLPRNGEMPSPLPGELRGELRGDMGAFMCQFFHIAP